METNASSSMVLSKNDTTNTTVEIAVRIPVDPLDPRANIFWPPSMRNPKGRSFRGFFAELQASDKPGISSIELSSDDVAEMDSHDGFLVVKIAGLVQPGQLVVPARFKGDPCLCRIDNDGPKEDGRTLYTIPQHKLPVKEKHFLFVIRMRRNEKSQDKVDFQIDQVSIKREGTYQFRITTQKAFGRQEVSIDAIPAILEQQDRSRSFKPMMAEVVVEYCNLK